MAAEPHQPARGSAALGCDRQASCRGEIEHLGVAPQFANHGGEAGASYPLLHCPQSIAGVARFDMDEVLGWKSRRVDPPAFEDRHAILDPQQRLAGRELRQQEPHPTAIARMSGEQL